MRTATTALTASRLMALCVGGLCTFGCKAEIIIDDEAIERSAERAMDRLEAVVESASTTFSDWINSESTAKPAEDAPPDGRQAAFVADGARRSARLPGQKRSVDEAAPKHRPLPERLKAVLPPSVVGLPRLKASASTGAGQMWVVAKAQYERGAQQVAVKVLDLGSMSRAARSGMTSWIDLKVEKSDDRGYRRTGTYKGWPTYEKYDRGDGRAKLISVVADRFLVVIRGISVSVAQVKSAFDAVDIAALSRLAGG